MSPKKRPSNSATPEAEGNGQESSALGRPVRKARLAKPEDDEYVNPDVELEGPAPEDGPVSEKLYSVIDACMDLGRLPEMIVPPSEEASSSKRAASARKSLEERGVKATSRLRGVTHHMRTGKWEGHIWDQGKQLYLGGFNTEFQAGLSHDLAIMKLRGPDSHTNFQMVGPELDAYKEMMQQVSAIDVLNALRYFSRSRRYPTARKQPAARKSEPGIDGAAPAPARKAAPARRKSESRAPTKTTPDHLAAQPYGGVYMDEDGYDQGGDYGSVSTTYHMGRYVQGFPQDQEDDGDGLAGPELNGAGRWPIPEALAMPGMPGAPGGRMARKTHTSSSPGSAPPFPAPIPLFTSTNTYRTSRISQKPKALKSQKPQQAQKHRAPAYSSYHHTEQEPTEDMDDQDIAGDMTTTLYQAYPMPDMQQMGYLAPMPIAPALQSWSLNAANHPLINPAAGYNTDEGEETGYVSNSDSEPGESSGEEDSVLGFKPRPTRLYPPFWIPSSSIHS